MTTQIKTKDLNLARTIRLPYCDLYDGFIYMNRKGYHGGVYGWNYDLYACNGYHISTGYRPVGKIKPDNAVVKKYEAKIAKVLASYPTHDKTAKAKVRGLISEFVGEVTKDLDR